MTDPDDTSVPGDSVWRIFCLGPSPAGTMALSALVAAALPAAAVDVLDVRTVSSLPGVDLFVVDGTGDGQAAVMQLETVRARGGVAPAVFVGAEPDGAARARLGDVAVTPPDALAASLPNVMAAAVARAAARTGDARINAIGQAVDETRQLVAAGRIARRVKHDINNPLAALLAEAQLLELEELGDEAREAVTRIVELTHRVIDQARQLDGPGGDGAGPRTA
jgi:signal transduction histidine kinase